MKRMSETVGTWLRGLAWTAMIFGCAWASAQGYTIASPATTYTLEAKNSGGGSPDHTYVLTSPAGSYHLRAVSGVAIGDGVGRGIAIEGGQNAEPAPKDDLFANTEVFAKNATHVTEITMDPDTLSMVGGSDEHKARNMVLNVVRSYTYDKPGMYNMSDVDALRNKLNSGDWHCSVHSRDLKTGEGSDICGKRRTDGMKEEVIMEVSPTRLTFIHTIRKAGTGGTGMLGYFPMLHGMSGMSGLSSLAMLDPEAFAYMQNGLYGVPYVLSAPGSALMLTMPGTGVYTLRSPDMTELNEKLKQLKIKPFDPQQMKKFEQIKPFQKEEMNKLQDQMKRLQQDFSNDNNFKAPAAPSAPEAAPAPATPKTPE